MRQFQFRVGYENFALIHVSLVPDLHGEQKTKPTQTTVHSLRGLGLLPDLVRLSVIHLHCLALTSRPDCMSPLSTAASQSIYERQNIYVLSRQHWTSLWCSRRVIHLPRPPLASVTRDHRLSPEASTPWQDQCFQSHACSRGITGKTMERNDQSVRIMIFPYMFPLTCP